MELSFYVFVIAFFIGFYFFAKNKTTLKGKNGTSEIVRVRGIGGAILFFSAIMLFWSSFSMISTNKVGIIVSFGRPVNAHNNGWAWKAPWEKKAEEFDGARQFLRFNGNGNNEEELEKKVFPCIQVKLDGQAKACINGVISWQMKAETVDEQDNALQLFKTYRTFWRLTENYVYSSSRKSLGQVYAHHNPLVDDKNQDLGSLNKMAMDQLIQEFSGELSIMSVDLAVPDYDEKTDESIAAMQAQKAKTRLAEEEKITNEKKALANNALKASVQDPAVNVANCIQAAIQLNKEPGYCLMGGSSVIVGTGRGPQP